MEGLGLRCWQGQDVIIERVFWVCCSMLQRVAVCCSMLQRVAVCCSVLQCAGKFKMWYLCVLQSVVVCCSVLQCVAVC